MKNALAISVILYSAAIRCAQGDTFGTGVNAFEIEFVTIGDPSNAADTSGEPNPAGSVAYEFRMGKFEISEQMIDKANAAGGLDITKDSRGPNMPATSVSWNEAARFVNWLNVSTGSSPAYKFAFQPGEGGYVANANVQLWTNADAGFDPNNLLRNSLARYFLPSVHEWYKAAYYDPASGEYFDFPTGSDSVPDGIDFPGDPDFDAVYYELDSNNGPNNIIDVGVSSPYGTAGQGGNVYEWQETAVLGSPGSSRYYRGGAWTDNSNFLLSEAGVSMLIPSDEFLSIGFRVARVSQLSGDYNNDGTVDAADYVVWRKGLATADYATWHDHFGETLSTASGSSAPIPEPASVLLTVLACVVGQSLSLRQRFCVPPSNKFATMAWIRT